MSKQTKMPKSIFNMLKMSIMDQVLSAFDGDDSDEEKNAPDSTQERGKSSQERGKSSQERGKSSQERGKSSQERGKSSQERGKSSQERGKSFNETGSKVDWLRNCMLHYVASQEGKSVEKSYRMKYSGGDSYNGIKYESLVIKATSRLEAIIKFKDYFNENAKSIEPIDSFEDDDFADIVTDYDDITDPGTEKIVFESKHFGEIMERFIERQFNNRILWFEEVCK